MNTPKPKPKTAMKIAKTVKKVMVDPTSVFSKSSKPTSKPKVKPVSPKTKPAMPKSKSPAVRTGDKAAEAMRKRTSPKGVKEFEKRAGKALEKKYPGLYKKSK